MEGDLVPGPLLNRLKLDLGDVAFTAMAEAKKGAGEMMASAERFLRKNIENYDDVVGMKNKDKFLV